MTKTRCKTSSHSSIASYENVKCQEEKYVNTGRIWIYQEAWQSQKTLHSVAEHSHTVRDGVRKAGRSSVPLTLKSTILCASRKLWPLHKHPRWLVPRELLHFAQEAFLPSHSQREGTKHLGRTREFVFQLVSQLSSFLLALQLSSINLWHPLTPSLPHENKSRESMALSII